MSHRWPIGCHDESGTGTEDEGVAVYVEVSIDEAAAIDGAGGLDNAAATDGCFGAGNAAKPTFGVGRMFAGLLST